MRGAAYSMVRFMTAGMALITCREPLNISINNNLRSTLMTACRVSVPYTLRVSWLGLVVRKVDSAIYWIVIFQPS